MQGDMFAQQDAGKVIEQTRAMHPENPWMLDRPLYLLGKTLCGAGHPKCGECYMQSECKYYKTNHTE